MNTTISITTCTKLQGINNITLSVIDDIVYINNNNFVEPGAYGNLAFYTSDNSKLSSSGHGLRWDKSTQVLNVTNIEIDGNLIVDRIIANQLSLSELVLSIDKEFETGSIKTKTLRSTKIITKNIETNYIKSEKLIATTSSFKNLVVSEIIDAEQLNLNKLIATTSSFKNLVVSEIIDAEQLNLNKFIEFKLNHTGTTYSAKIHSLPSISPIHPEWEDFCIRTNTVDDSDPVAVRVNPERVDINRVLNLFPRTIKSVIGKMGDRKGDISIDENWLYVCCSNFTGRHKIWKKAKLLDWYEANKL